ncbi:hypothetical protein [Agrococcus sp. TSP3-2-1]|uniref:hypothetical protein n=1 Tax=Agrococcus sp. TSP3-2-1 TaxID=2804583 RepID=UPI003CE6A533
MTLSDWSEHPAARAELLAAADRLPIEVASMLIDAAERRWKTCLLAPTLGPLSRPRPRTRTRRFDAAASGRSA